MISDLFMIFNVSGDGSMSKQEFVFCWNGWIKKVIIFKESLQTKTSRKAYKSKNEG